MLVVTLEDERKQEDEEKKEKSQMQVQDGGSSWQQQAAKAFAGKGAALFVVVWAPVAAFAGQSSTSPHMKNRQSALLTGFAATSPVVLLDYCAVCLPRG